jgi:hypothetical protein
MKNCLSCKNMTYCDMCKDIMFELNDLNNECICKKGYFLNEDKN